MVIYMAFLPIRAVALDSIVVVIATSIMECFDIDEQVLIGGFFTVLGDMVALNSSYLSYMQDKLKALEDTNTNSQEKENKNDSDSTNEDEIEVLKKSIDKIREELSKINKSGSSK